jgi:hypothetical protein
MAIRRLSKASITSGAKSSKMWDQETSLGYYESIATAVVDASGATIYFSNIPQTYQHLQVRITGRGLNASAASNLYQGWFKSTDTGLTFSSHRLGGDGSTAYSGAHTGLAYVFNGTMFPANTATANIFGTAIIDILDYRSTTKHKTIRVIGGYDLNGSGQILISSGLIQTLNPIDYGYVDTEGTFAQGTTISLYGIRGA